MNTLVKILFGIINLFLGAFVSYKVYGYFSPHVGFNLPELSYTNMLAIAFIVSTMLAPIEMMLKIQTIQDKVMGEEQAKKENEVIYPNNTLLRLNQFQIHKVFPGTQLGLRTFVKVSFSKDKYDLKGNSVNHLLDYNWNMRDREVERNIPQKIK